MNGPLVRRAPGLQHQSRINKIQLPPPPSNATGAPVLWLRTMAYTRGGGGGGLIWEDVDFLLGVDLFGKRQGCRNRGARGVMAPQC